MNHVIAIPFNCEVRGVIRFLQAEGHRDVAVMGWWRTFGDGLRDVHDEEGTRTTLNCDR